ncbi:MAG: hypothetical protein K9M80_03345 [Candidatus Marinimicrobia bacterium]|nr:hypothetical protein [Candidatus Neomarinimicrobiota bacterium]
MKNISYIISTFIFILLLYCCSENNEDTIEFRFPLQIGNTWEYEGKMCYYYYDDTSGSIEYQDTVNSSGGLVLTVAEKTDLDNIKNVYKLISKAEFSEADHINTGYYKNHEDGFYLHEINSFGTEILPNIVRNKRVQLKSLKFSNIDQLNKISELNTSLPLVIKDENDFPKKIIPYPIIVGCQWLVTQSDSIRIEKIIAGKDTLDLGFEKFECYEIKYLYDLDYDGEWDDNLQVSDYYNKNGLIYQKVWIKRAVRVNIDNPEGIGFFDVEQTFKLIDYNIED